MGNDAHNSLNHNLERQQGEPQIKAWDVSQTIELPLPAFPIPDDNEYNDLVLERYNTALNGSIPALDAYITENNTINIKLMESFENSRDEKAVTKVINLLQTAIEGIKSDVKDAGADYKLGEATQDALETLKAISNRINTKREKRVKRANKIIKKYTQKKKEMQL